MKKIRAKFRLRKFKNNTEIDAEKIPTPLNDETGERMTSLFVSSYISIKRSFALFFLHLEYICNMRTYS